MATAVARIVVQVTPQDKKTIAAKAKKLELPVSELMRRAAFAYDVDQAADQAADDLAALADAAQASAERAGAAIDGALAYIEASNRRIAAMEAKSVRTPGAASRRVA